MKTADISDPLFRRAVEFIDTGNLLLLQEVLEAHPEIGSKRLDLPTEGYFRYPYLLWFVAGNPVRAEILPENILDITHLLISYTRRTAGDSFQFQIDYTLGLVASGRIPRECGVQLQMIDLLVDAGAVPGNAHEALANGNIDAARHLIRRGGKFTLAAAVCFNELETATLLAKTVNQEDKQTALMAAAMYGNDKMLMLLIENGADVNTIAFSGFHSHASALHQAVSSGSMETVKVLVKAGAKLDAKDSVYQGTPLDWAKYMQTAHGSQNERDKYAQIEVFLQAR